MRTTMKDIFDLAVRVDRTSPLVWGILNRNRPEGAAFIDSSFMDYGESAHHYQIELYIPDSEGMQRFHTEHIRTAGAGAGYYRCSSARLDATDRRYKPSSHTLDEMYNIIQKAAFPEECTQEPTL